jgi:hypothetical protein
MNENSSRVCPVCKKEDDVVNIIYGLPSCETMEEAEKGRVMLGGCMIFIGEKQPIYYCKKDSLKFGELNDEDKYL